MNASHIVNHRYSIKGKDTHYLIKTDHAQAQTDLNELEISSDYVLFENINVTVHRNNRVVAFRANPTPETDIRLEGKHTVLNIRYGTTIEKEKKKTLQTCQRKGSNSCLGKRKVDFTK